VGCRPSGRRALILLLVEGYSDRRALPILAGKIAPGSALPKALRVPRGDLFSPDNLQPHIRYACQQSPELSKVLICVDSECTPIDETRSQIAPFQAELQRAFPRLTIRYVVVSHALEGWLLADRAALRELLGKNVRLRRYGNPEDLCRPAEILAGIFSSNNRDYIKTRDAIRLAEQADVRRISRQCHTFQDFQQAVRDP